MMNRRELFKLSGLSLAVLFSDSGYKLVKASQVSRRPIVWIDLSRDNYLTVYSNKSEMGQGVHTGLAMIVADELDFPWERVKVLPAPANATYADPLFGMQLIGGSTSIRNMYGVLRLAGATMKHMLLTSASERLKVPVKSLKAQMGYIYYSGGKLPYGELVEDAKRLDILKDVPLKKESEFIYIGKGVPRIDAEEKINGEAVFGIDAHIENALYATVIRPPHYASKAIRIDESGAENVKGFIKTIPLNDGEKIAIVAQSMGSLLRAKDTVKVEWSKNSMGYLDDNYLEKLFTRSLNEEGTLIKRIGNPEKIIANSHRKTSLVYVLPYLYHAHLEPLSCVVDVRKDQCTIYAPVQSQTWLLNKAKHVTELKEENIRIYTTYIGGSFGRKANVEFVEEALIISKNLGKPVKLIYTREEDVKYGKFRPMCASLMEGAIDEKGNVAAVRFKISTHSIGISPRSAVEGIEDTLYHFPNFKVEHVNVKMPFDTWFWRSVGHSHNAFIMETFIDQLAKLASKDPVDLRLELLRDERAKRVITHCAEKVGWGRGSKRGAAMGIAYHFSFGTHCAQAVEVSLSKEGSIKVHKVVCVMDMGPLVVHPDLARQQVESAIIMGLSAVLKEKLSFKDGRVSSVNFNTYSILRMDEMPEEIEVYFLKSNGRMGGVGEPPLPSIAPAIANALFWGYNKTVRKLPISL